MNGEPYNKVENNSHIYSMTGDHRDIFDFDYSTLGTVTGHLPYVNSFSGSQNASWRRIIAAGQDATTQANGVKYHIENGTDFSYTYHATSTNVNILSDRNQKGARTHGNLGPNLVFPNPFAFNPANYFPDTRNRAIRKFLESAKSARSSFESGQDLGELKQTIESLIHPMKSLSDLTLKYFSSLKKAKRRYPRARDLRKALSDSYLEYRFGWRPLALDIADAISNIDRRRMSNVASCFGSATDTRQLDHIGPDPYQPFPETFLSLETYVLAKYQIRIKGAIRLNLDDQGNIPLAQSLQLSTLNDFAVTAWDLLPYSFVVDYFTNVGDIVNSLTFPTSDLTYACMTEHFTITNSYNIESVPIPSDVNWNYDDTGTLSGTNPRFIATRFTRSSVSDSLDLVPTVRFSLPVSSRPWENIAALISSNTKSLVPFFK